MTSPTVSVTPSRTSLTPSAPRSSKHGEGRGEHRGGGDHGDGGSDDGEGVLVTAMTRTYIPRERECAYLHVCVCMRVWGGCVCV